MYVSFMDALKIIITILINFFVIYVTFVNIMKKKVLRRIVIKEDKWG